MRIHLYTMSLNEAAMLPFFFRHYDPWVERYVIYDDGSQDGTLDMLARHPRVEVRQFPRSIADSFVLSARILHDTMWKESRGSADWVIVTAIDEHLHHEDFGAYLANCANSGVTAIPALGFNMVARTFPGSDELLCRTRTRGLAAMAMNKLSLFDPDALEETRFAPGRHYAWPTGRVSYPSDDRLLLLHYKYLGLDYLRERNKMLSGALGAQDKRRGWGGQYEFADAQLLRTLARMEARSADLSQPNLPLSRHHPRLRRWWRRNPHLLPITWRIENRWQLLKRRLRDVFAL